MCWWPGFTGWCIGAGCAEQAKFCSRNPTGAGPLQATERLGHRLSPLRWRWCTGSRRQKQSRSHLLTSFCSKRSKHLEHPMPVHNQSCARQRATASLCGRGRSGGGCAPGSAGSAGRVLWRAAWLGLSGWCSGRRPGRLFRKPALYLWTPRLDLAGVVAVSDHRACRWRAGCLSGGVDNGSGPSLAACSGGCNGHGAAGHLHRQPSLVLWPAASMTENDTRQRPLTANSSASEHLLGLPTWTTD